MMGPMALSAVIKAGARLAPQAFGVMQDEQGGVCALGGVALAARQAGADERATLGRLFPLLSEPSPLLPCGCRCRSKFDENGYPAARYLVADAIQHLNDRHHRSRWQIAAWVRWLEK